MTVVAQDIIAGVILTIIVACTIFYNARPTSEKEVLFISVTESILTHNRRYKMLQFVEFFKQLTAATRHALMKKVMRKKRKTTTDTIKTIHTFTTFSMATKPMKSQCEFKLSTVMIL